MSTNIKVEETPFDGLLAIHTPIYRDDRGEFVEIFKQSSFSELGLPEFVQDNYSRSREGDLRGLHFQRPPYAQGKLVQVIKGAVLDIAVDLRKDSPTFKKYFREILSSPERELSHQLLFIPEGFAHGFIALEDDTIFHYKLTREYKPESESGLIWNDPTINVKWGEWTPRLSEKDSKLPRLLELKESDLF